MSVIGLSRLQAMGYRNLLEYMDIYNGMKEWEPTGRGNKRIGLPFMPNCFPGAI